MRLIYTTIFFILTIACQWVSAQQAVPPKEKTSFKDWTRPQKATLFSAIIPGAGQIYNKKYWKAPIVYAGFAALIYSAYFYTNEYNRTRQALIETRDSASNYTPHDPEFQNIPYPVLMNWREFYRKNRDLSYIGMAGLYLINIVDAAVDAHLQAFDVNENLSLKVQPSIIPDGMGAYAPHLSLHLYLK